MAIAESDEDDDNEVVSSGEMRAALRQFAGYLRAFRGRTALVVGLLVVDVVFEVSLPLSLQILIDKALVPKDAEFLVVIMAVLVGAFAVSVAARLSRDYVYSWLGSHLFASISERMFNHLLAMSPGFFSRTPAAAILARFTNDMAAIESVVVLSLPLALLALLHILVGLTVLFTLEWHLAAVVMVGIPFCLVGPRILGPRALAASREHRRHQDALLGMVQETVAAQAVIRAFRLGPQRRRGFADLSQATARIGTRYRFLTYLTEHTPTFGLQTFTLIVIGGGAYLVTQDVLTMGALVAFNSLFLNMNVWFEELSYMAPSIIQAAGSLRRVQQLLDEEPEVVDPLDAHVPAVPAGAVRFDEVTFGYAPGQPNLEGVSYVVPPGSRVAFVGHSGSGKSTNLNLIMRFFDPGQGRVLLDGVDIRALPQDYLYRRMGVVFQESFLFDTTIRENIRMGKPGASDDEVIAAAQAAELHDIVMAMPDGYETAVGERGGRLSGGQRQRVAIARALIGDPAILILDEATSALDPATEHALNATLERISVGKTVFSVTHRLQSVAGYDRILTFEKGRLAEQGSHEELLRRGGPYATLWRRQAGLAVPGDGGEAAVTPESLREFPLFAALGPEELKRIAAELVTERAPAGRDLIVQGDQGTKFFIIVRGKVDVLLDDAAGQRKVASLADGEYFGEMALLADIPTTATVRTAIDSVFLTLQSTAFQRLMGEFPHLREMAARTATCRTAENAAVGSNADRAHQMTMAADATAAANLAASVS